MASSVDSGGYAVEKKTRSWRKDKKQATEQAASAQEAGDEGPVLLPRPLSPRENHAVTCAFRGMVGKRTNFAMVSGSGEDAFRSVLGGAAFYYKQLLCRADDFSVYKALAKELNYETCWMSGGTQLWRPTALGSKDAFKQSPTYERIVRWLAGYFGVEPLRSIVNHYRTGDDYTSPHSDQYFSGVNMTIGVSFGDERTIMFEKRESGEQFSFPQQNGDIFAFTDDVNSRFVHSVPKEPRRAHSASRSTQPGRISVIVWAKRDQPEWRRCADTRPLDLLDSPHVLNYNPNAVPESPDEPAAKPSEPANDAVSLSATGKDPGVVSTPTLQQSDGDGRNESGSAPARSANRWNRGSRGSPG
eukprot:TRINITY_DN37804_c0_g1_i1.p1 TRINITY_DN37804_c0_g1~~TRINITY_DN37804_c0_g1_i1.p1  ORF type:complete len:358 (+),score=32.14 TRINITY_DN37804_c0_g1_i1:42-1115(+)